MYLYLIQYGTIFVKQNYLLTELDLNLEFSLKSTPYLHIAEYYKINSRTLVLSMNSVTVTSQDDVNNVTHSQLL